MIYKFNNYITNNCMKKFKSDELIENKDIKYFSEDEDKDKKKDKKKDRSRSIGLKLKLGGLAIKAAAGVALANKLTNNNPSEESKKFYDELKKEAIEKGYDFKDHEKLDNAYCSPGKDNVMKGARKVKAALHKQLRKSKIGKNISDFLHKRDDKFYKENYKSLGLHPKRKGISLDMRFKGDAGVLAHEMGHGHYFGEGKKSLGGLLHNPYLRDPRISTAHSILQGIHSGIKAEKKAAQGKKESKWNKYKSVIIPGIHSAVLIGSEAAASMHGYKKLKEMGASEELLKKTKKDMISALGMYLGKGAMNMGTGAGARFLGKKIGKKLYKNKKKEENKEED